MSSWVPTEIDEFDGSALREQDVVAFDVAMHAVVRVQITKCFESFLHDIGDYDFG